MSLWEQLGNLATAAASFVFSKCPPRLFNLATAAAFYFYFYFLGVRSVSHRSALRGAGYVPEGRRAPRQEAG